MGQRRAVQGELISKKFPAASGFEASYKFTIESAVPRNLAIVIERPDLYSITCNGKDIKAKPNDWWLDKAFGRIDIASVARTGENVITLKASPFTMYHELEPAYLLGNFALKPVDRGFVLAPDRPFHSEPPISRPAARRPLRVGTLKANPFTARESPIASASTWPNWKADTVALGDWCGSVAKVAVNGKPAGYIDAPPWECDVTKWVKRGQNAVEVTVIGTLKNTLGPHHGNPKLGAAWPSAFHIGPTPGHRLGPSIPRSPMACSSPSC